MNFKLRHAKNGLLWIGFLFLFSGCTTLVEKPPEVAWHQCYRPVSDAAAHDFLKAGLVYLKSRYGRPDIPVNKVLLRYSQKSETARAYLIDENFSRTEIVDAAEGVFCIYIGVPPDHDRFYYLLGHEIGHLQYPRRVDDPKMEQFCNEFSGELCEKESRPFDSRWENRKWVCQPKEKRK